MKPTIVVVVAVVLAFGIALSNGIYQLESTKHPAIF